jgi:hypothetical protein
VIETLMVFLATDCPLAAFGSNSLITFGFTTEEAIKKNSIKKNMMSLIEEALTSGVILCLRLKFIIC